MKFFFFLLLLLPFAELYTLIKVFQFLAKRYDALSAVFLVLLSFFAAAAIGMSILRAMGGRVMREIQGSQAPGKAVLRSIMQLIAAVLFIIPGYISDVFAILLLLPPVQFLFRFLALSLFAKWQKSGSFIFYGNNGPQGPIHARPQGYDELRHAGDEQPIIIDVETK